MTKQGVFALGIYLLCINLLSIILTVSDKRRSIRHQFRVPEKVLFLVALLGGSIGEYGAMRVIRHKTLHKRFMWGLPAMMILQAAAGIGLFILLES